jgi:hypothetical protein
LRISKLLGAAADQYRFGDDPLRFLRIVIGTILLVGTAIAILFAVTGVAPRALVLAGALWAIYGFATALITGVLEPAIDFAAQAFSSVGLNRVVGYSAIETMVARGQYEAAAEAYRERAQERRGRVEATLRRAALLAGPLAVPAGAVAELRKLRQDMGKRLTAADDVRIGLALADLHEFSLKDPGWAMAELRRLIDLYPHSRRVRQMRSILAALKTEHFGH